MLGFLQLFSGGALTQFADLRARDHAVHHGVDHHADPRRGDPQARGVAAAGRGRPAQDHPVDPLPRRSRIAIAAGHRPRLPVPQRRRRALGGAATPPASTCCPNFTPARGAHRGAHPHRRHRAADVDGRAHHPAGHRQRHVAADLRLGRSSRSPAQGAQLKAEKGTAVPHRPAACSPSCCWWPSCSSSRASAASRCSSPSGWSADACTAARAPTSRSRSTSRGVIPIIFASSVLYLPHPAHHRAARPTGWGANVQAGSTTTSCSPTRSVHMRHLRPADHRLRRTSTPPSPSTRPSRPTHPQAGRLHPRHPARSPDRALPGQDPVPHHPAGRAVHRLHRPAPVAAARPSSTCSNFPFAGTSILIAVGVALETMKQIDSQLMMRNYEGFLK